MHDQCLRAAHSGQRAIGKIDQAKEREGNGVIYYVGYYTCDKTRSEERIVAPAAENKMSYIISALSSASNTPVTVVSAAQTKAKRFIKGSKQEIQKGAFLKSFSSFNSKLKIFRAFGHMLTKSSFFMYLLKNVKRGDNLLVYHSLAYKGIIKLIHKFKKCKLTIEVEELYSDVSGDVRQREKEIRYLQTADSYIFITELLKNEVNTEKPSVISHGTYLSVPDYGFRFDDGQIHVVYAGTFRKAKGGAYTAIEAAEHLDSRYTLEVLGGGSEEENQAVKELIQKVSQKTDCKINYAGFKSGKDFNEYIQACHIGLSTQQADARFNGTSFPSKVLMYMSNGLRVVSVRIPAVESSAVGDSITYYDKQDGEEVARAVRSVSLNDTYNSRNRLDKLHRLFTEGLKQLLLG